MDIEELKKANEKLTADLKKADEEHTRMAEHQTKLLDEAKVAKSARKETEKSVAEMQAKLDKFDDLDLANKDNYEGLVKKGVEKVKLDFETKLGDALKANTELTDKYNNAVGKYNGEKIAGALRKAAEVAKVLPGAIDDIVARASGVFSIGDDGTIEARDADNILRKSGGKQLTPEVFVESLKKEATHFWPASKSGGANGDGSNFNSGKNPFLKKSFNRTEQTKIANSDPDLAQKMMDEAKAEDA